MKKIKYMIKSNYISLLLLLATLMLCVVMFRYNPYYASVMTAAVSVTFICWVIWSLRSYKNTTEAIRSLNKSLTTYGDDNQGLISCPFPSVVCSNDGTVLWFNTLFEDVFKASSASGGFNIKEMIDVEKFEDSDSGVSVNFITPTKKYSVYRYTIENNQTVYFFIDDTFYKDTLKEFNRSRPVVLLISVDALDNSEDSLTHLDYNSIINTVETTVCKWLSEYNCAYRKFNEGRIFAFTEDENLQKMIGDKFYILEEARQINDENKFEEISVSIGIGKDKSFQASEIAAREAIEMAKGRGGDQVALKAYGEYQYFGGNAATRERKNKVVQKLLCCQLDDYIKEASCIYIMGHAYSDFDSLGAAIGVAAICKKAGKYVRIICNKSTTLASPLIKFMEENKSTTKIISVDAVPFEHYQDSLLVITDTCRSDLLDSKELFEKCTKTIVIDHHRKQANNAIDADLYIHDSDASSACELVSELVEYTEFRPKLTRAESTALLSGIILDTKNFSIRCNYRTFQAAAFLKAMSANTIDARKLFAGTAEQNIEISKVLASAEFCDGYAIGYCSSDSQDIRIICSKAADSLLDIQNVNSSYVIFKSHKNVQISARSLGKFNVQTVMERLGGGGHATMAACQLGDISIEEARNKLVESILQN